MNTYSLFELNEFIRRVLALNLPEALWVRCELAEAKTSRGHYYFQLVQKAEDGDDIVAQGQAVLWNRQFRALEKKFGRELEVLLQAGQEVLMLATVEFHERYGLKLSIEDFDSSYTLGKLELKRRETLRQLQQLGLLEKNRQLPLPPVLQRLAVITSEGAAGYQDFLAHLAENPFGYRFRVQLFQSAVQGVFVENEMLAQLEQISRNPQRFDAVCIIRGGGGKLDLAAFDSLSLGMAAAAMPLPIFTGIGHDTDESVLDQVAHTCLKTPTAVADHILHHNLAFESAVADLGLALKDLVSKKLKMGELRLRQLSQMVEFQSKGNLKQQKMMLEYIQKEVPAALHNRFSKEIMMLDGLEKSVEFLSPDTALKRGFGIVYKGGKALKDASQVEPGDEVAIVLHRGSFTGKVTKRES